MAQRGGRTDEWMYGWMYVRTENLPILQDSSPIGAAALPPPMKTKEKVEQGKGTADHLMPLGHFFPREFSATSLLEILMKFEMII